MLFKTSVLIVIVNFWLITSADYWIDRDAFIKKEKAKMLGSSITLKDNEHIVNNILMYYKLEEYDLGLKNPDAFAPSRYFFDAREDIENSKVFKFIKNVPKGAVLHGHDLSMMSFDYLYNLTYRDNLYACSVNKKLELKYMLRPNQDDACEWTLLKELRRQNPSYDKWVRSQLTLDMKNAENKYPNINVVWEKLINIFNTLYGLIGHKPVYQDCLYQTLKELHDDNVMYLEFRTSLPLLYELNGDVYTRFQTVQFIVEVLAKFKKDYPDFLGARIIYSPNRKTENFTISNSVNIMKNIKSSRPNLLAGYDLVGQEDLGYPLKSHINHLQEIASNGIDFFFHAGETKWYGCDADFNLVDAVLLGTKRIGHGYALTKHPLVMEMIKDKAIAIEVCPISNQVLMLVDDMRNHPAASLIAEGYPVVVSNDDPGLWSAKGLSYDFYMMFMGIAGKNADLKVIKQLAKNSILYSAMPEEEKHFAVLEWEKRWNKFIDDTIMAYYRYQN